MTSYITARLTSDTNIEYLNQTIVDEVRQKRNLDILPQNKKRIKDLVYYIHNEWFNDPDTRDRTYSLEEIINLINKRVIKYAVRDIVNNYFAAKRYQEDLNTLPTPPALPLSTSNSGVKLPENIHPN